MVILADRTDVRKYEKNVLGKNFALLNLGPPVLQ